MTNCAPGARLFLLLFLTFSLLGCSQFKRGAVSEEKDPHFLEARKRATAMDWDGAIEYFEKALQNNPTNAAAHFELGVLYDMRKDDYGAAIYHYQKHIKLRPNTPSAQRAEDNIVACKRQLAKTVSYEFVPRDLQKEMERYALTNSALMTTITNLKTELARRPQYITNYVTNFVTVPQFDPRSSARLTQPAAVVESPFVEPEPDPEPQTAAQVNPAPETRVEPRQPVRPAAAASQNRQTQRPRPQAQAQAQQRRSEQPKPAAARTKHRVRPGDTLDVIARRYGISVAALKAANPGARNGARSGQELVIPAR